MSTTIEKALSNATTVTGDRTELLNEVQRLIAVRESLLPVETTAKTEVQNLIDIANRQANEIKIAEDLGGAKVLSQDVFAWTKKQKVQKLESVGGLFNVQRNREIVVPALAFLPLDKAEIRLTIDADGDTWVNNVTDADRSGLPVAIHAHYREIARKSVEILNSRQRMTLVYSYAGVVPTHVKDIIQAEYGEPMLNSISGRMREPELTRFDSLALVCDADRWETNFQTMPEPRQYIDPILVGVKGDALWVLAAFDPTPLEEYLASEFTT